MASEKTSKPPLDPESVYFVKSEQDPTALLARRAVLREGHVCWDDTNRDRLHEVSKVRVKKDRSEIMVVTAAGWEYRFMPLTLELYEAHVQEHVELSPSFDSTEELLAFYRTQSFG